ncbi:mucin-2-like [Oncorhynchus masou masou]|uniref:mucin-2-like n=1 Tax=Oncorhynchus masou masou TaxID=90313 RepID=UPI003183CD59
MVSKEPNHLLIGQYTNSNTADKPPGAMTVRSVLLNRDSPDIESRLKRRRNRTHQVRFKDLEDGVVGRTTGAGTKGPERTAAERDSPHPLRKNTPMSPMAPQGWLTERSMGDEVSSNQASVVGAVRGDMADTIEVVAAFLARAPPHPLTPGPTRRCWAPPSPPRPCSLTLPLSRRQCASMAIQTPSCLMKPKPRAPSAVSTRNRNVGDSVGVNGDDEQDDKKDEYYTTHNHISEPASIDGNGLGSKAKQGLVDQPHCLRTSEANTEANASSPAVGNHVDSSRHDSSSSPPPVWLRHTAEPCYCGSVTCGREGSKRQGSATRSQVRRRWRMNRGISDPGREVSYCTTPTQTDSPCVSPPNSPPPSTVQPCTSPPPSTVQPCTSPPPSTVQPCTSPPPSTVQPCTSPPPSTVQPCTSPPPSTVQPCTSPPPSTVQPCTSPPPSTVQPCTTQTQTDRLCASPPPPTVQHCASPPPPTVQHYASPPPSTVEPSTPKTQTGGEEDTSTTTPAPSPVHPTQRGVSCTPGSACQAPLLRRASEKERSRRSGSPLPCPRASSLKQRAQTPLAVPLKGNQADQGSSPTKAISRPTCLGQAQAQLGAQLGALHKILCSGTNTPNSQQALPPGQCLSGARGCSGSGGGPTVGPLTSTQADTLRQVQEILGGLVSGARSKLDPTWVAEKLMGPNGPLHDIRSLQTQLHSMEGVLETSQNTIKVLLDVIQDLEKKEAERDGRHSYRTGQDIENCGTCRDCACIIYSVEHDFRLQEGAVTRTWRVGDPPEGSPLAAVTPQPTTPHRQDSPLPVTPARPPHSGKKSRKKCFWFL